jgi:hypothetical protein
MGLGFLSSQSSINLLFITVHPALYEDLIPYAHVAHDLESLVRSTQTLVHKAINNDGFGALLEFRPDGQCKSEKTWCIEDGGWSSYEVRWWPRNAWAAVSAGQRAHRLGTVTASGGSASSGYD